MKTLGWLIAGCILAGAVAVTVQTTTSARAEEPKQVLRHVVLYKFKPEVSEAQLQEVIDAFAGLPAKIDKIVGFEHGKNVSPEGKSEGLTHAFVVTFRDEAGRDAYLKHPAHQAYVNVVRDRREKVIVFDYWAKG
ncbi:MAG TPA: Dabb family protein [Pirellulales bacterium]|nr:Dabb family protein [Pirellulales bacterium]